MSELERAPDKPSGLRKLSFDELQTLAELDSAASAMSYYNAAEGDWGKERKQREAAAARLRAARAAAQEIGFDLGRGYLC